MRLPSSIVIAARNLARNGRRTALALAAIATAEGTLLAYQAIVRGYMDWGVAAATGPLLGDLQVHHPLWRRERALNQAVPASERLAEALRQDPAVAGVRERAYAPALAAAGRDGTAAVVLGLDLARETGPNGLLPGLAPALMPGPRRVLLGKGLAHTLGVGPGAELALVGQGADGSVAAELVTVAGVVATQVDMVNRLGLILPLDSVREIFTLGSGSHELIVNLRPGVDADAAARRLAARGDLAGLEVRTWRELAPELASFIKIADAAGWIVMAVVFLAAAAGVANTLMMSAFERKTEFGVLLALGAKPRRIVAMVMAEAALLALAGGALGSALALAFLIPVSRTGMSFSALAGGGSGAIDYGGLHWSMAVFPQSRWQDFALSLSLILATALAAAFWPARRSGRLEPVEAMRP